MEMKIWGCAGAGSLITFVAQKRLKCQVFMSNFQAPIVIVTKYATVTKDFRVYWTGSMKVAIFT